MVLRRTWCHAIRSAFGYKRTLCRVMKKVYFTPEGGHSEGSRKESAYAPKML